MSDPPYPLQDIVTDDIEKLALVHSILLVRHYAYWINNKKKQRGTIRLYNISPWFFIFFMLLLFTTPHLFNEYKKKNLVCAYKEL